MFYLSYIDKFIKQQAYIRIKPISLCYPTLANKEGLWLEVSRSRLVSMNQDKTSGSVSAHLNPHPTLKKTGRERHTHTQKDRQTLLFWIRKIRLICIFTMHRKDRQALFHSMFEYRAMSGRSGQHKNARWSCLWSTWQCCLLIHRMWVKCLFSFQHLVNLKIPLLQSTS